MTALYDKRVSDPSEKFDVKSNSWNNMTRNTSNNNQTIMIWMIWMLYWPIMRSRTSSWRSSRFCQSSLLSMRRLLKSATVPVCLCQIMSDLWLCCSGIIAHCRCRFLPWGKDARWHRSEYYRQACEHLSAEVPSDWESIGVCGFVWHYIRGELC